MGRIPVLIAWALCLLAIAFAACPEGQSVFGSCCYKLYKSSSQCSTDFSFSQANSFCQANGGQLVSIHSEAENKFVQGLIKHAQGKCHAQRDFVYWTGLQLSHGPDGTLNGATWTDGSFVDFGSPLGNGFQPPFVKGAPARSDRDAVDEVVCPAGNENNCVQIIGFGHDLGLWRDANCSKVHEQANTCSQTATVGPKRNCTSPVKAKHDKYVKDDEDLAGFCRAEAATNGFICKFCGASQPPTTTTTTEPTTTTTTATTTVPATTTPEPTTTTATTTPTSTTTTPTTTTTTTTATTTTPSTTTTTPTTTTTTPTTTTATPTTTTTTTTATTTTPTTTTTTPTTTTTTAAPTTTTTTTVPPPVVPLYACPDTRYPFPRCCGTLGVLCDPAAPPTGFVCVATDRLRARCCGPIFAGGTGCVNYVEATRIN